MSAYSVSMSIFAKTTAPRKPKTDNIQSIALLYAAILVVFVVSQLFTFESFNQLFESFWLPGGVVFAHFLAAVTVIAEVLALPFLLRMRLSRAMRLLSMVCGWLVAGIWLFISLWLVLTVNAIYNIGFFGEILNLQPGWWAVLFCVAITILSVWASWGMWPLPKKK